jgi:hypothetical protein
MLNSEAMREYVRSYRVRFDTARERLRKAIEEMERWKEQVNLEEPQRDTLEHPVKIISC